MVKADISPLLTQGINSLYTSSVKINIELKDGISHNTENYVRKKLEKLTRYIKNDSSLRIIISLQKGRFLTEFTLEAEGSVFHSSSLSSNIKLSIDKGVEKLLHQLKKFREKLADHNKGQHFSNIFTTHIKKGALPTVKTRKIFPSILSLDEAVEELSGSHQAFFVFINKETNNQNIVYKEKDGTYSLIEL